ncbi:AMP-binding protein, partial [Pseudonocardia sp. Ae505_Ps2]
MLRTELIRPLHELVAGHASERGDTVAFADRVRSVTYAELHVRTGRLAGHLAALRLHPGDRAVILQGNAVEVVESYLAVLRASGVAVPCNPAGSADELAHVLDDSGARVVLTDPAHLEQVLGLLPGRSSVTVLVTGDGPLPRGVHGYERLARTEPPQPARDDQDLDDVAFMLYTSGTTGSPKGVLSTQRSCLWSVAACYAPIVGLAAGDRVLWPLPLHHSLAHVLCVVG